MPATTLAEVKKRQILCNKPLMSRIPPSIRQAYLITAAIVHTAVGVLAIWAVCAFIMGKTEPPKAEPPEFLDRNFLPGFVTALALLAYAFGIILPLVLAWCS